MTIFVIVFNLIIIGCGFLIGADSNLGLGYRTMSEAQKKSVEIDKIVNIWRKGFFVMGVVSILGYFFFKWLSLGLMAEIMIIAPLVVGIMILFVITEKYNHNTKNNLGKIVKYVLIVGLICAIFGMIYYSLQETKITTSNDEITFSGLYGVTIKFSDIDSIELSQQIPTIRYKSNGFAFGGVCKGFFKLDKFGKCRLYLTSGHTPFIIITEKDGLKTIFNSKNPVYIQDNYLKIKDIIKISPKGVIAPF